MARLELHPAPDHVVTVNLPESVTNKLNGDGKSQENEGATERRRAEDDLAGTLETPPVFSDVPK